MSEVTSTTGEGSNQGEIDYKAEYEKLIADYTETSKSKERLLEESKTFKSKYQEYKTKAEKLEQERLEKDGTLEQKLEAERKRMNEILNQSNHLKEKVVTSNFKSTLQTIARDARDIDDLMNLPQVINALKVDQESLEVDRDELAKVVNELKEKKPYLFNSATMAKEIKGNPTPVLSKPIGSLNDSERKDLLKNALAKALGA